MIPLRLDATARHKTDSEILRSEVFFLIKEKSFSIRRIMLASGKESNFYFDMKSTMLNPSGAKALSKLIYGRLCEMEVDYIGGLAIGAIPLVACVAQFSEDTDHPLPGFFVRKEVKNHGTKRAIEGLPEGETLAGKNVVILDDVTTTGSSSMIAVEAAKSAGANVILVLSVVDRQEGALDYYRGIGIRFESIFVASEFLQS